MTERKKQILVLADIDRPAGLVEMPGTKRELNVHSMSGEAFQLWNVLTDAHQQVKAALDKGEAPPVDMEQISPKLWELAQLLIPDATAAEIKKLTAFQIGVVVTISLGGAEQVAEAGKEAALYLAGRHNAEAQNPPTQPDSSSLPSPDGKAEVPAT